MLYRLSYGGICIELRQVPQLNFLCRHRPIFPGRFQPSIFGTNELNYRVRDGNGWTLIAINTDLCRFRFRRYTLLHYLCSNALNSPLVTRSGFEPLLPA